MGRIVMAALVAAALLVLGGAALADGGGGHEVWAVDQSNTTGSTFGGTLYVYDGASLAGQAAAVPERIDLGGAVSSMCLAATGANPQRPHMLAFNGPGSHAILAFVATGHVVFLDAATRQPVACLRTSPGAAGARQAHAAFPAPDGTYVIVANQNGKLLERIRTDYATNSFVWDGSLDLASGSTPNGAPRQDAVLRPDNAPICPIVTSDSRFTFVTLRGGGLFVVDTKSPTMQIVAEYDRATVHGNGCGGAEAWGKVFVNSGGGTAANLTEFDVYSFPLSGFSTTPNLPNTPAPTLVFRDDAGQRDSHGMAVTKHGRYLWVADRWANSFLVFDVATGEFVGEQSLVGVLSGDPSPDLLALAPAGNRMYVTLRGPVPLTGDPHASTGSTPGVGIIRVEAGGRTGTLQAIAPISNPDAAGVERADPHAIAVRGK